MTDVVAFDIDGTLTRPEVLNVYKELSGVKKGIVTRRRPRGLKMFLEENNIETDFKKSSFIKSLALNSVEGEGQNVYVGNTVRDMLYARVARWDFVAAHTVSSVEDIPLSS